MSFVAIATGTAGQNQLISRGFKGAAPAP
jgi:hypothetical protein